MTEELNRIQRRWRYLILLHGSVLLHLFIYILRPDVGNSTSFRYLVVSYVGLTALSITIYFLLTPNRLTLFRRWLCPWRWVFVGIGLVVMAIWGMEIRPEWIYPHIGIGIATTFGLVYWSFMDKPISVGRWRKYHLVVGGILVILIIGVRLNNLTGYPKFHVDEARTLSWTLNHIETGQVSDRIVFEVNGTPRYDIPRFYVILALWSRIVGFGLWQGRLFTFLLILVLIPFSALAANNLYGKRTAWFTAVALFFSAILLAAVRVRHDIGLAIAMAVSLWLYSLALKHDRERWHFYAGLAMGFGLFAHYNATFMGIVMTLSLYGPRYIDQVRKKRFWPEKGFWLYIAGGLLAASIVVVVQVLPDLNAFLSNRSPRQAKDFRVVLKMFDYYFAVFSGFRGIFSIWEFTLIALGILAALWRRTKVDLSLVLIVSLGFMGVVVMMTFWPAYYYLIPLIPFCGILIGALFSYGWERQPLTQMMGLAVGFFFMLFIMPNITYTLQNPVEHLIEAQSAPKSVNPVSQWIRENYDPDTTIIGPNRYYLDLVDYHYGSPLIPQVMLASKRAEYDSLFALWDDMKVDIFIVVPGVSLSNILEKIMEGGYMDSRGYEIIAQIPDGGYQATLYGRKQ